MRLVPARRVVALLAIAGMALFPFHAVLAADGAVLAGRVVDREGFTPRAGVVVRLVDVDSERSFASTPTGEQGAFRVEGAPAGSYAVLAETEEGKYLAADRIELAAGDNTPVQLALDRGARPLMVPGQTRKGKLPGWARGVIAGGMVVAMYYLFDNASETDASKKDPF